IRSAERHEPSWTSCRTAAPSPHRTSSRERGWGISSRSRYKANAASGHGDLSRPIDIGTLRRPVGVPSVPRTAGQHGGPRTRRDLRRRARRPPTRSRRGSTTKRPVPPPPVIRGRASATLEIDRIGLAPALLAELKHVSSLHNLEFYEKERGRRWTGNTPRFIRCYQETVDRILLPRGLREHA